MKEPVTKEQYEFYRAMYDQEERTALQLEGRAKVYLGIVSAFLAAMILKAPDAEAIAKSLHIPWGMVLVEALPMTIGLALILWSLRIRNFEAANDGMQIISDYGDDWTTEDRFYEDRIVDYAFASSSNRRLNNKTAAMLSWSSWFMGVHGRRYTLFAGLSIIRNRERTMAQLNSQPPSAATAKPAAKELTLTMKLELRKSKRVTTR